MTRASVGSATAVVPNLGDVVASTVPGVSQPWTSRAAPGIPTFLDHARADTGFFAGEYVWALEFLAGRLAIESHAGDHYEDEHGTASFFGFSRLRIDCPCSLVGFVTKNKIIVLCTAAKSEARPEVGG